MQSQLTPTAYKSWKLKQILNKLYNYSSYRQCLIWKWTGDINFKETEKKTKKGGLLLSYIKPRCCKNVLLKRHGQLGFHFLMFFWNMVRSQSLLYFVIKEQIFGDKKDVVSVPYLTIFGFLVYNSLRILKSYGIVSLTLKTSLNTAGDRPCRYL